MDVVSITVEVGGKTDTYHFTEWATPAQYAKETGMPKAAVLLRVSRSTIESVRIEELKIVLVKRGTDRTQEYKPRGGGK